LASVTNLESTTAVAARVDGGLVSGLVKAALSQ